MELYLPEKYKVLVGEGAHIGLCTVWSDPNLVTNHVPQFIDTCAIIGTLYSKEGVNIILRNLCLNPQITHVFVWGKGQLSQTPTGKTGWSVLVNLWQNGVADDGTVNGDSFKLHENMDFSVINNVVKNVQLIDVSGMDLEEVAQKIRTVEKKDSYMQPVSFPVYQREASGPLPSEEVGWAVRGRKTANAWIKAIDRIVRYGKIKTDEYGSKIKELAAVTWVVEEEDSQNPYIPEDWPNELKSVIGVENNNHISEYIKNVFIEKELPKESAYTYGQRLRNYPAENGIDQIEYIINKLKDSINSRRAFAVTWNPSSDQKISSPPCIALVQALHVDGKLNILATVRSHDMFKAALLNAFGLRSLQEEIAKAVGLQVGRLSITSNSAHIYEDDWDNAKKLVQCAIWERPPNMKWGDDVEDPRCIVLVRVENKKLVAEVMTREGELITKIEGDTSHEVVVKLSELELLSLPRHYMDIARQLQKAEIARDLGVEFEQDKPLKIYSKSEDKEIITGFR